SARGRRPDPRVRLDHRAGVGQVPERVDDQSAAPGHPSRAALSEPGVVLQTGEDVAPDLDELHLHEPVIPPPRREMSTHTGRTRGRARRIGPGGSFDTALGRASDVETRYSRSTM